LSHTKVRTSNRIKEIFTVANLIHIIPLYRYTSYSIGLLLGFILRHSKGIELSNSQLQLGWIIAITSFSIAAKICISNQHPTPQTAAYFVAVAPVLLGIFTAWIIFVAQLGHKS
jgi:hypothetical protein